MKRSTLSKYNVLQGQVIDMSQSKAQDIRNDEHKWVRKSTSEMNAEIANAAAANTGKQVKTKLFIKNMVSLRCKMVVKAVLDYLDLEYSTVELGEVEIFGNLTGAKQEQLRSDLLEFGLVLLDDNKSILVEKIKTIIIDMIHYSDELPNIKNSFYVGEKLNHSYTYLANLFSEVTGKSIQHFIILHKIERAKELIVYDDLTLSEIAGKLKYSSVAHLSLQFKKVTGLTPSHFKNMKQKRLTPLEEL